jgi:hypothetical protein
MKLEIKLKELRPAALLLVQFMWPGASHLWLREWRAGLFFLILWPVVWALYGLYRPFPRVVLLIVPVVAAAHLVTIKGFSNKNDVGGAA